jgi:hypothetical protein
MSIEMTLRSGDASVTAGEMAQLLSRIESTVCRRWHVRRCLTDLIPSTNERGRTRVYSIFETCLVRLAIQLEREGVSAWAVRAVLANHADSLRRAWADDAPLALAVRGVRGWLVPDAERASQPIGTITVSLPAVRHGLLQAMRRIRRANPTIPLFNRRVSVQEALRLSTDAAEPRFR